MKIATETAINVHHLRSTQTPLSENQVPEKWVPLTLQTGYCAPARCASSSNAWRYGFRRRRGRWEGAPGLGVELAQLTAHALVCLP